MALARCETCGCPEGTKQNYAHVHVPLSFPPRHVICAKPACVRPAYIWLTDEEEQQYLRGERNFRIPGHPRVQVT
jgi:hypothetical protein